jgi:hypothetical protein
MYKYVTNMIKYSQIGAYSTLFDRQIFSRSRSFDDIIQISRQLEQGGGGWQEVEGANSDLHLVST